MRMITALITLLIALHIASAAHFIVGYVEDAIDGEPANGKTVILWNEENGIADNVTDIVGPTGNSGSNNIYLIDCELLNTPCDLGDNMTVMILPSLEGYFSLPQNVTVTGAGFDVVENISLNSPLNITQVIIEDDLAAPESEIDLSAGQTKQVSCVAIVQDSDGEEEILNASAEFFDNSFSSFGSPDDNNDHYTNSSCFINTSYGDATQAEVNCTFTVEYYANPGTWNCSLEMYDNSSNRYLEGNTTMINELLAIGVESPVDFGIVNTTNLSEEVTINLTNYGNIVFNLSMSTYGTVPGDGLAMTCNVSGIVSQHQKYNITNSFSEPLGLGGIFNNYSNLSTGVTIANLSLGQRTNDLLNDANQSTYWRMYVPQEAGGNCTGNTILGAVIAPQT